MRSDGTNQTRLTYDNFKTPDWQPLRALDPFPRPGGGTP